jgi:RimJ/RimL family protein N-acetyltransferase
MTIEPVVLENEFVRLEPLMIGHVPALCAVGLDDELWAFVTASIQTEREMRQYVESALQSQSAGTALPFATIDKTSGRVAGSTRFGNIDVANRRVEIGWTWLGREFQRSVVNTSAKLLMLTQAFEEWGCYRVEFKTDVLNNRSRAALRRIGATEEGILRKHMITAGGRMRDSVYYSILDTEWSGVKTNLEMKLKRRHDSSV